MDNISLEAKYASSFKSYILDNNILKSSRIIPIDKQLHFGNCIFHINCVLDICTTIHCSVISASLYNITSNFAKSLDANILEAILFEILNNNSKHND